MEDGPARNERESSPFFTGSIGEAILIAKSEKRTLIVYIAGENEDCRRMDETTWRDFEVQKVIREQFVTLRLLQSSTDAAHFFAIYPFHEVPSISVINISGMLLKQSGGYVSPNEFLGMIEQIKAMQTAATIVAALASANTGSTNFPTQGQASSSSNASEKLESKKEGTSTTLDKSEACCPPAGPTEEKLEDDASHQAPQMNESDVILKTQEGERESSPPKQVTASESGTSQGNTEQLLVSTSCVVSLNETRCQNVAASGESETESNKQTANMDTLVSHQLKASPSQQEEAPKVRQSAETLLIQVRLTNGKSIRRTFNVKDSLAVVKEFVDQNRDDGNDAYSLAILYPRKVFGQEDLEKSLLELSLEDRATLVLVTSSSEPKFRAHESSSMQAALLQETDTGSNGGIWKLFSYLNPLSYWSGSNSSNNAEPGTSSWQYEPNLNLRNSLRQGTEMHGPSNPNTEQANTSTRKKGQERNWGGKIHTLQHSDNDDAFKRGNAFWNGNSTQFGGDDSQK